MGEGGTVSVIITKLVGVLVGVRVIVEVGDVTVSGVTEEVGVFVWTTAPGKMLFSMTRFEDAIA